MCLEVVEYKLKEGRYHSTFEFIQDVREMFNAFKQILQGSMGAEAQALGHIENLFETQV